MNFGTRRIQKNGYTSLLPLPAAWAKNFGLVQGSLIKIEMLSDNSLRIFPVPTAHHDDEDNGSTTPFTETEGIGDGKYDIHG
ncbi:MAG: hypothetical protein AB9861_16670 [Methanosarcina sp.]